MLWSVRLGWLENAYTRPLIRWAILPRKVCHTDLVFGVRSGFISRFAHTHDYKSLCAAVTIFASVVNNQTHRQDYDQFIWKDRPAELRIYKMLYAANESEAVGDQLARHRYVSVNNSVNKMSWVYKITTATTSAAADAAATTTTTTTTKQTDKWVYQELRRWAC